MQEVSMNNTTDALRNLEDRLNLIYRLCCGTSPKQSIGELLDATMKMPEWAVLRSAFATCQQTQVAQPDTADATADQCIELAGALEIEWAKKAITETKAIGARLHEGPFSYGWESACEEIETRIGTGFPIDAAIAK